VEATVAAATIVVGYSHVKVSAALLGETSRRHAARHRCAAQGRKRGGVPDDRRRRINRFN